MTTKAQREIAHKLRIFEHARHGNNFAFTRHYLQKIQDTLHIIRI